MAGKAKAKKHTAKQMATKAKAALQNKGGGNSGLADRKGGKAGHAKFQCPICMMQAPSLVNMKQHHESKHSKLPWDENSCVNTQEAFGGTTQGVAVLGSKKKRHK
eukprot:118322_1